MKLLKKINKKSLENYWFYYKFHTYAAIFAIVVLIVFVRGCYGNVDPDASVSYIGQAGLSTEFTDAVQKEFTKYIKDVNKDNKKVLNIQTIALVTGQGAQQKAQLETYAGDSQIFITDKDNYIMYAANGLFAPLDSISTKYNIDLSKYPNLKVTSLEKKETHVYGIPLINNGILNGVNGSDSELYLSIRVLNTSDAKNKTKVATYNNCMLIIDKAAELCK